MSKFNHKCPFCKQDIPKIYVVRTVSRKKKGKLKFRTIKEAIGEDWSAHAESCKELEEFLNKTK